MTQRSSSIVDTDVPIARSPDAMSSVSRARNGCRTVLEPTDTAESTSARAVMDFEPGSRTVPATGCPAVGAVQGVDGGSAVRDESGTQPFCRSGATKVSAGAEYGCPMCGRYASTRSPADLAALFDAYDETEDALVADYNVAPTDPVPIVRLTEREPGRIVAVARWGLVPAWAPSPDGAARMINARAETVARSPAFARSFAQRRCLVPADGWYEWVRSPDGRRTQPYYMTRPEGLAFGGIWSVWSSGERRLVTFSVVTLAARGRLAQVHHRMPLVLTPQRWEEWLLAADAGDLLVPAPDLYLDALELRPVARAVGDVRNDGPELIQAIAVGADAATLGTSGADTSTVATSPPTLF
jgi:putative SOS response-associated peptidase YedK